MVFSEQMSNSVFAPKNESMIYILILIGGLQNAKTLQTC